MKLHQDKDSFHHKLLVIIIPCIETKINQEVTQSHHWFWHLKKSVQGRAYLKLCPCHQIRFLHWEKNQKLENKPHYEVSEDTETNH